MQKEGAHIRLEGAGLTYGRGDEALEALRNVTFEAAPGESVALIGPSGCGKSTTLRLIAGLKRPTEGEALVNGKPITEPRQATAFIQQDLGLFPWKTVLQNAAIGLMVRKVPRAQALERARRALERVGLSEFERSYPKELSGGMKQRLALARALAMDADLLLMDEPLSAIDALLRESLQDTLLRLWQERGHTQLLVTHSIEEAVFLGQRILVFSNRPATVICEVSNPAMGTAEYRATEEFLRKCAEVRRGLMRENSADGAGSSPQPGSADGADLRQSASAQGAAL